MPQPIRSASSAAPRVTRALTFFAVLSTLLACTSTAAPARPRGEPEPPPTSAGVATLPRLTRSQYAHAVRDLFGPEVLVPSALEPDGAIDGSLAVGATETALSRRGVEQYERAAYAIATQAMTAGAARDLLVPCEPAGASDATCARTALAPIARRAWRRELSTEELDALVSVASNAGTALGDFHDGLEFGIATILQSPDFLYRPALGSGGSGADGDRAHDAFELASRLSFFLWDSIPDDTLLDAAASGSLVTDATLAAEVDRMLGDPRAREGLRAFVTDWLGLGVLSDLSKDPMVFLAASPELGPSAREETLRFVEHHVLDRDAPLFDLILSRETFVDRRLAALYEVRAPSADGFGMVTLPEDGERRGLLGQASLLAIWAHPTSSSPTLRGRFVRETLLCQFVPPPPVSVDTAIPEPSPEARTLRDRLTAHRADPTCASCHARLDPIGLGLERFDGIGHFRRLDEGATIDPSGDLDGEGFEDASELAEAVAGHPDFPSCFVSTLYRYATGQPATEADFGTLFALESSFATNGYRVRALMRAIVLSSAFRAVRPEGE